MRKILAFGASSSTTSINKKLATYAAGLVANASVTIIDLNDFEMPIFSVDREKDGIPDAAIRFKKHIAEADAIILSIAEHNGTYSAAFKNIFDWASRVEKSLWLDKPMLLLSTSPGGRGGKTALDIAAKSFGYMNGKVVGALAVPSFNSNFSDEEGLIDESLKTQLAELINTLETTLAP